ncbi:MAG: acylneuraminate cytidylyltransferase family protein [Lachnospiraceae bacterium]|nr:acylneuraminate cytidylyltransferase family protein [Lachnospiraceae bacterium]
MKNIAVIPARSGSKGLKDKNIKELNGKPLLVYSIEAAQQTGKFNTIHVSTDSEYYAEVSRGYGADVPFLRSAELASDTSSTWDAMRFVLENYRKMGKEFDTITVLQPTSPLRTAEDINGAFQLFEEKDANMISSVCEMEHSPLWSNTLPNDLSMKDFEDEKVAFLPRQSLPTYYRENGAIYLMKTAHLFSEENIYKNRCYAYIMQQAHSVDIDDEMDFMFAEVMIKRGK